MRDLSRAEVYKLCGPQASLPHFGMDENTPVPFKQWVDNLSAKQLAVLAPAVELPGLNGLKTEFTEVLRVRGFNPQTWDEAMSRPLVPDRYAAAAAMFHDRGCSFTTVVTYGIYARPDLTTWLKGRILELADATS